MVLRIPPTTMLKSSFMILTMVIISTMGNAMRFDLESGRTKCISDELKKDALTVGRYNVVRPDGDAVPDTHKITVKVTTPNGDTSHFAEHVDSGHFAFTSPEAGGYSTCFWTDFHDPTHFITVEFDWRTGVAAKDWPSVAKQGQVEALELELKKLYDIVASIHDEIFYLREREEEMQDLNRATASQMTTFGFLSLLICLSVAGMQFWHLKSYFERKKLL